MRIRFSLRWILSHWGGRLATIFLVAALLLAVGAYRFPQAWNWVVLTLRAAETSIARGENLADQHEGHADADEHEHGVHADGDGDEDEHDHAHEVKKIYNHVHDEAGAIKISDQAKGNIGLRVARVALSTFERTITVPGIVVERPGWSVMEVTTPMTGW